MTPPPRPPATQPLARILHSQGFGTRRACEALAASGRVGLGDRPLNDPDLALPLPGLVLRVDGLDWPVCDKAIVVLHKPAGHECSRAPGAWPSVLALLPAPLRTRGVQPVGRLDQDTTGLLLLTDDGALLHRLTSPRRHVAKVYEVTTADPLADAVLERLREGVTLRDDPRPARALACERTGERALRLTIDEGRYHQVKRMLGACGHRVTALHRSAFGPLALPADLAAGAWRWLGEDEARALRAAG